MKLVRKTTLGIFGALQGAFGSWWLLCGIAGAFPGTEPGTKDYDEDMWFVPFGWGMMLMWFAVMAVTIILNRKSKVNLLVFLIPWLLGTVAFFIFATLFRKGVI